MLDNHKTFILFVEKGKIIYSKVPESCEKVNLEVIKKLTEQKIIDNKMYHVVHITKTTKIIYTILDVNIPFDFIIYISHELRSILTGMIGMTTLMEYTQLTPEQYEYTNIVKECNNSMLTIVSDLLDYIKIGYSKIQVKEDEINIRDCLDVCINTIIFPENVQFDSIIAKDVPINIVSDYEKIKQVLINLLRNSCKNTINGKITIDVSLMNVDCIRIKILDTGCGIDDCDIETIFMPFTQVNRNRKHSGTGLGLYISKQIALNLGGDLVIYKVNDDISNEHMYNTCFVFTFKFNRVKSILYKQATVKHTNIIEIMNCLSGKKIMVLDDKLENRLYLAKILLHNGADNVQVYSNVNEALIFCEKYKFDLGIIDICMDTLNGVDFVKRLKQKMHLLALTSLDDMTIYSNFFKYHLLKPVTQEVVLSEIYRIFNEDSHLQVFDLEVFSRIKVLIYDDSSINFMFIKTFLKKIGIVPDITNSIKSMINIKKYDIVFVDVTHEIDATIFKYEKHSLPLVIEITLSKLNVKNADHVIYKPISFTRLFDVLKKVLEHQVNIELVK